MLVLATRNPGKLREFRELLAGLPFEVAGLDAFGEVARLPEPEETGETFAENARLKALYYAAATGQWCLADDSGLVVDALSGEPGVRSARYAGDEVPPGSPRHEIDQANNRKLLRELAHVPDHARTARFVCHVALACGAGVSPSPPAREKDSPYITDQPHGTHNTGETPVPRVWLEADGAVEGRILHAPRGHNGFGYDPLFFIDAKTRTTAELPADEKNELSHRGQAMRKLAAMLRNQLG